MGTDPPPLPGAAAGTLCDVRRVSAPLGCVAGAETFPVTRTRPQAHAQSALRSGPGSCLNVSLHGCRNPGSAGQTQSWGSSPGPQLPAQPAQAS